MPQMNSFGADLTPTPWAMADVEKGTPVLLALSGGADSRMLLHLLALQSARDGFPLTVAHVNHGIRGAEALRDRDFCKALATEYGVELCLLEVDVPRLAKEHGRSLEEEAREVRYAYFSSLMRERKIPLLVTAHNADDNAETVLFRMARGSGLCGLCGIEPVRPFANGCLVRPLLGIPKREVLAFCAREGLEYVTDSTNADTSYARNRLRAEVMPVLEDLFAGAAERIFDMTADLRADEAVLADMAERFLNAHCENGECSIAELRELSLAIRRRVLSKWFANLSGASLERVHLDALEKLIDASVPHSSLSLPARVQASVERGALTLAMGETVQHPIEPSDYRIPFERGETVLPDGAVTVLVENSEKILKVHNLSTAPYIILKAQSAIIEKGLFWRPRKEGDRILMGGIHRAVRRLYREAGIHPTMRARLPLLCDADGIVWAPYCGVRDGVELADEGLAVRLLIKENG